MISSNDLRNGVTVVVDGSFGPSSSFSTSSPAKARHSYACSKRRLKLDQVRRQRGQRQLALVERLAHQPELELLEVTHPRLPQEPLSQSLKGIRRPY
jgi:hypothetical protein